MKARNRFERATQIVRWLKTEFKMPLNIMVIWIQRLSMLIRYANNVSILQEEVISFFCDVSFRRI